MARVLAKIIKDMFTGRADSPEYKSVKINQSELAKGITHEMEHTKNVLVAKKIALDHLVEDPLYYTHLEEMERKYSKEE